MPGAGHEEFPSEKSAEVLRAVLPHRPIQENRVKKAPHFGGAFFNAMICNLVQQGRFSRRNGRPDSYWLAVFGHILQLRE